MTNSTKENGQTKVCDQREHRVTQGREARGLALGLGVLGEVADSCCGFLLWIFAADCYQVLVDP